jgi:hypothetical protein
MPNRLHKNLINSWAFRWKNVLFGVSTEKLCHAILKAMSFIPGNVLFPLCVGNKCWGHCHWSDKINSINMQILKYSHKVKSVKKIWCASWARVNLPHIGIKRCIKIVLQRNLLKKLMVYPFFSRNLFRRYRWDVKYQNYECLFLFLNLKKVTKSAVRFNLQWNFINKTQGLILLSRNVYGRYPRNPYYVKFQKSECFFLIFGPQYSYQKCYRICSTVKFL